MCCVCRPCGRRARLLCAEPIRAARLSKRQCLESCGVILTSEWVTVSGKCPLLQTLLYVSLAGVGRAGGQQDAQARRLSTDSSAGPRSKEQFI